MTVENYIDRVECFFAENIGDDYDLVVDLELALDEDNISAAMAVGAEPSDYAFQCLIDYALH